MKKAIILIGPPGSGKGTQGDHLIKEFNLKRYIMSDLLKNEIKNNIEIKKKIDKGELLSDDIVINTFKKYFKFEDKVLIDGVPRSEEQAKKLNFFLKENNYDIIVLNLEVNEQKLYKRIINRYYCPKCGRSYNLIYKKPKNNLTCDYDGENLVQRKDDTPEIFKKRLETYDKTHYKIIDYYKENNTLLYNINGDKTIENVFKEISIILSKKLNN